jgi:hypothetical protein
MILRSIVETDIMNTQNPSTRDTGQVIRSDIKAKWDKFSDQELMSLKNKDDLVTRVAGKYGLEKFQAQRDVDSLLKGREIPQQT